jgi:hypothetical protein
VSPFRPSFLRQPSVFSRSPRPLSPLSTAFTPNRSLTPLSTAFTQTHRGVGYLAVQFNVPRHPTFRRSDLQTPFCPPFVFITFQIHLRATPSFSNPYKTPAVSTPPDMPIQNFAASVSRCLCGKSRLQASHVVSYCCKLLVALCAVFRTRSLCFQQLAASFCRTPRGGGISEILSFAINNFQTLFAPPRL